MATLNIGDPAPDFTLQSGEGKDISLKSFLGKKVVLYFYPKDDTPGCTKEACSFGENIARFRRKGAELIGVSADSPDSHKKFSGKYHLPFLILSDESKKIIKAYGVWKEKSMYGKKYMGIERTTFIIDEQGAIAHIFSKVRVDGHTDEVLEQL